MILVMESHGKVMENESSCAVATLEMNHYLFIYLSSNVYICMHVYNQNDTSGAKSRAMRFVRVGHVTNKLFKQKKKRKKA